MFLITSVTKRRYFVCRVHETWQTAIAASCGLKNEDASLSKQENRSRSELSAQTLGFYHWSRILSSDQKKNQKVCYSSLYAYVSKEKPTFVNKSLRMWELLEGSGRKRQKKTDTFRFSTSSRFLGPSNQFFFFCFRSQINHYSRTIESSTGTENIRRIDNN